MAPMPLPELMARMDRATAAHAEEQAAPDPQARLSQLRQALAAEGTKVSETALAAALCDESVEACPMAAPIKKPTSMRVVFLLLMAGWGLAWVGLVGVDRLSSHTPAATPPSTVSTASLEQMRTQQDLLMLRAQMNLMQGDLNMGPNPSPTEQRRMLTQQTVRSLAQGYAEAMTSSSSASRSHP